MADQKIGTISHYYPKIGVAVVKLTKGDLKVGDTVKLTDAEGSDFNQVIDSMQIEHASIEIAKSGDEFGLKTEKEVKAKSDIFKAK